MPQGQCDSTVRGLSLLELIIALALTSILAGIGVLAHQALRPSLDLAAATRQVVLDLKVARVRAVSRNLNERIVFAKGAGGYQMQRQRGTAYADDGPPVALPTGIVVADCSARGAAISFCPRGNAGSFGTVVIQNTRGDVRRVVVDIAGQIRVP